MLEFVVYLGVEFVEENVVEFEAKCLWLEFVMEAGVLSDQTLLECTSSTSKRLGNTDLVISLPKNNNNNNGNFV